MFSKILKHVIAFLRIRGISLIYPDNLLIAAGTYVDSEPYETSNFSSGVPGFSNQLRKIHNNPHPKARILGLHDRFNLYVSRPPSRENPVNKIVSPKASENKRNHFCNFISRFIGLCTSAKYAVPQAPLHYRSLQFLRNPVLTLLPMAFSAFFNYGGGGFLACTPENTVRIV